MPALSPFRGRAQLSDRFGDASIVPIAGAGQSVRHDPDRPHDRTCFRVGTGLRSYSSAAPLGAEGR